MTRWRRKVAPINARQSSRISSRSSGAGASAISRRSSATSRPGRIGKPDCGAFAAVSLSANNNRCANSDNSVLSTPSISRRIDSTGSLLGGAPSFIRGRTLRVFQHRANGCADTWSSTEAAHPRGCALCGEQARLAGMIPATARVQAAGGVRTLSFDASSPLQLSNGEHIAPLTIAFETYGALNIERTNAVLVCHSLTGDQFVASPNPVTGWPAWWPRIVGPGRPIDTNRFFVVCSNVLGGSMGTTGPGTIAPDGLPYSLRLPAVTMADAVRAQAMLVEALGIENLFLVIGPGMGGMQALQWASAYPKRVFACVT